MCCSVELCDCRGPTAEHVTSWLSRTHHRACRQLSDNSLIWPVVQSRTHHIARRQPSDNHLVWPVLNFWSVHVSQLFTSESTAPSWFNSQCKQQRATCWCECSWQLNNITQNTVQLGWYEISSMQASQWALILHGKRPIYPVGCDSHVRAVVWWCPRVCGDSLYFGLWHALCWLALNFHILV